MTELTANDKELLAVVNEVSELLTSYKFIEVWPRIGKLNSLLAIDDYSLPEEMLEELRKNVKSYYYQEQVAVKKARRVQVAIGHSFAELTN